MRRPSILALALLGYCCALAQGSIHVSFNLNDLENDQLKIIVKPPEGDHPSLQYYFPKQLPGLLNQASISSLVSQFEAYDTQGQLLGSQQLDNGFLILNAQDIAYISYTVDDSWDDDGAQLGILPQVGTAFSSEAYLLNMGLIVGYFNQFPDAQYQLEISTNPNLLANTSLPIWVHDLNTDLISAASYVELIDNPILYTGQSSHNFQVGQTHYYLASHSPANINQGIIYRALKPVCEAVEDFCGGYPVQLYQFIVYLKDPEQKGQPSTYGAIQHSNTSVFYLPAYSDTFKLKRELQKLACHEMLHLYPPLMLNTDHTTEYDLQSGAQTQHLWLYEGVTEYFSWLIQLRYDMITEYDFVQEMRNKMNLASFYEPFSLSQESLELDPKDGLSAYPNFYYKGALAALLLDLEIIQRTEGKEDLQSILGKLHQEFADKNIPEEELIDEIIGLCTSPQLFFFFKENLQQTAPLNYQASFEKAGKQYTLERKDLVKLYANVTFRCDQTCGQVSLHNISLDNVGFEEGDVLIQINGKRVYPKNVHQLMDEISMGPTVEEAHFLIERNGKLIELWGSPSIAMHNQKNLLETLPTATDGQKAVWRWLLYGKPAEPYLSGQPTE